MESDSAVSAFVLAGGESSRMGRDKALLTLPTGETLLARALRLAKSVSETVKLVAPNTRYSAIIDVPVIEDVYPGCGPLGGIHAALSDSLAELNLVLGVDCPLLTPELLKFLLRIAGGTDKLATVPRVGGYLQNVCAVYRKEFAKIAEEVLSGSTTVGQAAGFDFGKRRGTRIDCLILQAPSRIVEEEELRRAGFGPELFLNVNTSAEFEGLIARLQDRRHE